MIFSVMSSLTNFIVMLINLNNRQTYCHNYEMASVREKKIKLCMDDS